MRNLPINGLKIDPTLTGRLETNAQLIRGITALSKSLGFTIMADGVSSAKQLTADSPWVQYVSRALYWPTQNQSDDIDRYLGSDARDAGPTVAEPAIRDLIDLDNLLLFGILCLNFSTCFLQTGFHRTQPLLAPPDAIQTSH